LAASKAQRAATAERRSRNVQLRMAGVEWEAIAVSLGYASRGAACKDFTRAMGARIAEQHESAEVLRETELLRLDRMQRGLWPAASAGDTRSADTVLRIIDKRMQLLRLNVPPDVEERLRRELVARVGTQMYLVFGQVIDGLGLTPEQRAAVPDLVERAVVWFSRERRAIEGTVA
jgi:hypothetical protein